MKIFAQHQRIAEAERQQAKLIWQQQRTLEEQERLARAQRQALELQRTKQSGKQKEVWDKLQQGEVLTDQEMKQLFHMLDFQRYGSKTQTEKQRAYDLLPRPSSV